MKIFLKNKTHDDSNKINKSQEQCVDLSSRRLRQTWKPHFMLLSPELSMSTQHFFRDLWSINTLTHLILSEDLQDVYVELKADVLILEHFLCQYNRRLTQCHRSCCRCLQMFLKISADCSRHIKWKKQAEWCWSNRRYLNWQIQYSRMRNNTGAVLWLVKTRYSTLKVGASLFWSWKLSRVRPG